jgi:bacterioferritin
MQKIKIIEMLNADLQDEHGAIIQYLTHAYAIGEGEVSCEIEAIARDEMRHLDWLAETIVDLGGKPSLIRGAMNLAGQAVPDWMTNDVGLEAGAINNYTAHIKMIDDPAIQRLLERIISDENAHRGKFEHFIEKTRREGLKDIRGERQDADAKVMNWGIGHEYTVVLQYMFHAYMSKKPEARKQFEDQAINEMQHLGWLSEELAGGGGNPIIEHTPVDRSLHTADMLKADLQIEKEVAVKYDRAASETPDAGLKELLQRIRDNEIYHAKIFTDLLKKEKNK